MATSDNLKEAFAGESQANRRYLAFAKRAESDGFPMIAKLFRAIAEAETIHAHAHFRAMGGVKTTEENLKAAIEGERYEYQEMYPKFLSQAEAEDHKGAAVAFKYAKAVEETHHTLYQQALQAVSGGTDLPNQPIYVCDVCGHTVIGEPPEHCPVCGALRKRFFEVT